MHTYLKCGIRAASILCALFAATAFAAPAPKVDLCHKTGNGYNSISVSGNAVSSHLAHGDVVMPNGTVPGSPGFVFDKNCNVVGWIYATNATVDASAQSGGDIFAGSGIPASGFGIASNVSEGIELGLQIIYRQGPTVLSTDTYADGILHYQVNPGPQSTANGSFQNKANRAAWSFEYSIATGIGPSTTDLNDYTFELLYDVDPGLGTSYRTLTLEPGGVGSSGFRWRDQGTGQIFIQDDSGNANVTQNSENYAFLIFQAFLTSAYGPGNSFAGPGHFDIILQAKDGGGQIVVRNHIVVDVLP